MTAFKSITVALDALDESHTMLDAALEFARGFRSEVTLVSVVPTPELYMGSFGAPPPVDIASLEQRTRAALLSEQRRWETAGVAKVRTEMPIGRPAERLLQFLDERPTDLLIVGSRGLSGAGRLILGSVSDAVVHRAPCPVLVVRPRAEGPAPTAGSG
jgi:nucleotide-binding universal stress UspA family protein